MTAIRHGRSLRVEEKLLEVNNGLKQAFSVLCQLGHVAGVARVSQAICSCKIVCTSDFRHELCHGKQKYLTVHHRPTPLRMS